MARTDPKKGDHLRIKLLHCDLAVGRYVTYTFYPKMLEIPKHKHFFPVHSYTVSGQWHYEESDWIAGPGTYVYEALGAEHTPVFDQDTVMLNIVEGPLVFLNENNEVTGYNDADRVLESWRDCLKSQGIDPDDAFELDKFGRQLI
jgi:hypothetical protein